MDTKYSITVTVSPAFIDALAQRVAEELRKGQPQPPVDAPVEDLPEAPAAPVKKTVPEVVADLKAAQAEAAALVNDLGLVPAVSDDQMRQAMIAAKDGVEDFQEKGRTFLRLFSENHRNPDGTIPVWTRVTKDIPVDLRDEFLAGFYGYIGKKWEGVPAAPVQQ